MYYADNKSVIVSMQDLPTSVKGFAKANADDSYTIVLNSRLSYEQNKNTYLHEIEHIMNDDFHSLLTADDIEAGRHK